MKLFRLFLFTLLFFQFINTMNYYLLDDIFNIFDNLKADESDLKIIIEAFSSFFKDIYAFNEVAKNPPQPSFNNEYYEKIDIQEGLKNIKIKDTNMYKFYQEFKLLFDRLGDQHLYIGNQYLEMNDIYFSDPLKLSIKAYENKARMFGDFKFNTTELLFRNGDLVYKTIENNLDTPIKTINGKDPFDFITNFAGNYEKLKSPQGTFRYKFYCHNSNLDFYDFPLSKENLINFTVVYENNDTFSTDYIVYSEKNLTEVNFKENFKSFISIIKENKSNANLNTKFNPNNFFIARNEKFFRKLNNPQNFLMEEKKDNSTEKWAYFYSNYIACRVDHNKKVNIYAVTGFGTDGSLEYSQTIKKCTFLFDKNKYPIIVVNVMNPGGLVYNSQYLLESLNPNIELNLYGLVRKKVLAKENQLTKDFSLIMVDTKNCEPFGYKPLLKSEKKVDYGSSVSDTLLGPFIFNGRSFVISINDLKKNLKNPRKPTEILIYTDGFSYSATSLLLKYMQYNGGAITAGYFCNPNLDNIPYDSSLSPSSIFTEQILKLLDHKEYKTLNSTYNYSMIIAVTQMFYTLNDFKRPLEYEVTPVDEKVNIYFDKVYKEGVNLVPEEFDIFINDSLKIFEKYKTQCNPDNKKLLLITSECDGKFGEHAHGGYECGDDGLWTNNCVASYCDIGYVYDFDKKICVENVCKPENVFLNLTIAVIFIIVGIIIIIIALCMCIKINEKRRKKRMAILANNNNTESLGIDQNKKENLVE